MSDNEYSFRKELDIIGQMVESDFTGTETPWKTLWSAGVDAIASILVSIAMEYQESGAIVVNFVTKDRPTHVYSHRLYFSWYNPNESPNSTDTDAYDRAMKGI